MAKNPEVKVTFTAFNKEFNKAVGEMKKSSTALRQELKLEQSQLRLNGTQQEKLQATVANLAKQYEVAKKRTQETTEQLEKVKQQFGENSNEVKRMETELRRAQIAEQDIANRLEITTQRLEKAKQAEAERTSQVGKAKEQLKELQKEEERLSQISDNLNKKFEAQKAILGENASETKKAKLEYDHLQQAKKITGEQTENLRRQLENAKTAYGENSREVKELEGKLYDAVKAEQEIINKSVELERKVGNAFKVAGSEVKEFGDKLKDSGRSMTDAGKNLSMKVTAPIAAFTALSVKTGMEFESSMSNVAAVSGYVGDELEELEDKAREMGRTTNKSAKDSADALSYMALAGWDNKQMLEGIEPVLKLSSAGNLDLARTSDLVTDSMSALGIEVDELDDYLDVMAKTAQNSNTDIDQMGEAFITAGGKMRDLGIDFKEGGVALGLMADAGIKGSEAGRGLSAILTRLTSPTGQAKKALEELGVSAFDMNGDFIGIEETLKLVEQSMDGMTQEQKTMYRSMLAGQEHGKTFSALINSLGDDYDKLKGDVANANGALDEMYKTMTDNLKGQLDELLSALQDLQIVIYKAIQPALEKFIELLQKVVEWFAELSPSTQRVMIVLAGIAAVIGPLLIIFGQMSIGLGSIIKIFGGLIGAIGKVGGSLGLLGKTFAVLSNPITIIIAIVAALIGVFVHLYKTNEEFREKMNATWEYVKNLIMGAVESIRDFVMEIFGMLVDWWNENNELIMESATIAWETLKAIIIGVMEFLEPYLFMMWTTIKTIIQVVWDFIQMHIKNVITIIMGIIKAIMQIIQGDWKGAWETVKDTGKKIWDNIKETTKKIVDRLKNDLKERFEYIKKLIPDKIKEAKEKAVDRFNEMRTNIVDRAQEITDKVKEKFDKAKENITKPIEGAKETISKIVDQLKGFFDNMKLKIPKIEMPKLPKFKLDGKFSLNPPSVPKISVNWNAKGGIFRKPTIFSTANAGLQGVGEAGPEAILPLNNKVLGEIGNGIFKNIERMLMSMLGNNQQIIQPAPIYLDGELIGHAVFETVDRLQADKTNLKFIPRGY